MKNFLYNEKWYSYVTNNGNSRRLLTNFLFSIDDLEKSHYFLKRLQ